MAALAALAALAEAPLTPNRGVYICAPTGSSGFAQSSLTPNRGVYIYAPLTQAPLRPRPGAAHHSAQQFSNSRAWVSLHG